ncbi:unnamed protein product [Arctia plantaginis]|uniref:Mutant cadherin n=1 Tax=Arctia plantaginis TaxID=874455 RepID=A0A8S1BFR1_ARCPL|nr:unnamed protein product [Arctia plantaginis]
MAETIIIDEFLTFIQNKIDVLDELSILQICGSNFTEVEIEKGKTELFNALSLRNIQRKGDDKNRKNIKDVIKAFKESDPLMQPIFVAKNLNRLPPVTFDYVDVTRLLKDINVLKNELHQLRSSAVSKKDLEMYIKNTYKDLQVIDLNMVNNSCEYNSESNNQCDKDENGYAKSVTQKNIERPSIGNVIASHNDLQMCGPSECEEQTHSQTETVRRVPQTYRDILHKTARIYNQEHNTINSKKDYITEDGFTLVTNKKRPRSRNMRGTATSSGKLLVAEMQCAIYVSRLKTSITAEDIKEHICTMGEDCVDVQVLNQKKETNFRSFKIIVLKHKLNKFLNTDFWPNGVIFRLFRERSSQLTHVNKET